MKVHDITRTVVSTAGDGKLRIVIWWKGGWDDGHADTAIFVPLDGLRSFGYFPDEGRLLITADANYDLWFRDRAVAVDTLTAIASYWLAHVSPDVDEPGDAEAVPDDADTDEVLTDEMLTLFSSQLENAKPDSLWVMSAPQVAALVETTQRYRQYVRADPAITGEIDDDQLVRWLEQFDRVPSDTLCSITRADLVHLLETTRRYGKIAEALRALRTIQ